jgi:hypothetical protein
MCRKGLSTLKALANVSPGFAFETLGSKIPAKIARNPERGCAVLPL